MQITEEKTTGLNVITSYGEGYISVSEKPYRHSLIISPNQLITDWKITEPAQLSYDSLIVIENWEPDIVLLGTGPHQIFPESDLMFRFLQQGIGCEIMDSAAACRTYNILMSESRKVVAALLTP